MWDWQENIYGEKRVYKYTEVTRKIEQETLEYTAEPNQRKTREAYLNTANVRQKNVKIKQEATKHGNIQ